MAIKIKLMADYGCDPLWWAGDHRVGNINLATLPLSQEIIQRLYDWADAFDARLNLADPYDSPEVTPEEVERFEWEGLSLWKQLNQELVPDYEVVYFSSHFHQVFTDPVELEEKLKLNLMKFNRISWEDARKNISQLFDQVVVNRDIIVINRAEGESVVLMAIEELNNLIATAHLDNKKQRIGKKDY